MKPQYVQDTEEWKKARREGAKKWKEEVREVIDTTILRALGARR